jgi:serine/threonine-protein kinase
MSMRSNASSAQSGQLPTVMASESGLLRAPSGLKSGRTAAIAATVLGLMSLFVIVAVVFAGRASRHESTVVEADGAVVVVTPPPATTETPVSKSEEEEIKAALADIDKGDYGSGITALTQLEADHMDRADIHRALYRAYMATKSPKDAMREAGLLFKADPTALKDEKLLEDIRNTAVGKDGSEDAFLLLENGMGSLGLDILYDVAHAQWSSEYPLAAARAQKVLNKADVRARTSAALSVTLDLRAANTCDTKKALLQRAHDVGDFRTAALLRTYVPTRGCGFLSGRDCWPCLHKDNTLKQTIQAIDDRTPRR